MISNFISRLFSDGPKHPLYGEVLVHEGMLTDKQLTLLMLDHEDAVKADPVLIGARAVARGYITPEQADHARIKQKQMRGERIEPEDLHRMQVYAEQHRAKNTRLSRDIMLESERLSRAVRGEVTGILDLPKEIRDPITEIADPPELRKR